MEDGERIIVRDDVKTPLNACSVETIQTPIPIEGGEEEEDNGNLKKRMVWPMMLGCYQLDESTGRRKGRLDLYAVDVPSLPPTSKEGENNGMMSSPPSQIKFGPALNVLGGADDANELSSSNTDVSGVLDGKWEKPNLGDDSTSNGFYYATAHASGSIGIHLVQPPTSSDNFGGNDVDAQQFQVSRVAGSEPSSAGENALCLSLSWDYSNDASSAFSSRRIISSYSDGHVAIHNVSRINAEGNTTVTIEQVERWEAHTIFRGFPAEVWCASFTMGNPNVVLTGGDDATIKIWDIRSTQQPCHVLKHFEAGATVLSPHPRREHIISCGSYDETMILFDLRMVPESRPKLLCHTDPIGGGLWRMKWHPLDDDRLLLGAMHGGCRVLKVNGMDLLADLQPNSCEAHATHKFTKHESMAYGADWLVYQPPLGQTKVEAAASCSFYDKAMYLWDVH